MKISALNSIRNNNASFGNIRSGREEEPVLFRPMTGEDKVILAAKGVAAIGIAAIICAVLKENNIHPEKMFKKGISYLKARFCDVPPAKGADVLA